MYISFAHWYAHTCKQLLNLHVGICWIRLRFSFLSVYFGLSFTYFCVSLDHFIHVLLAFVVLGLVSSAPSQEIGRTSTK